MALELPITRELTAETTSSDPVVVLDAMDNSARASPGSSTPPTSLSSGPSDLADAPKEDPQPEQRRSARARASVGTYNLQVLVGTNIHTPTKYLKKGGAAPVEDEKPQVAIEKVEHDEDETSLENKLLGSTLGPYWKIGASPAPTPTPESTHGEGSQRRKSSRLDLVKEATNNAVAAASAATSKAIDTGKDIIQSLAPARGQGKSSATREATSRTLSRRPRAASTPDLSSDSDSDPASPTPEPRSKPVVEKKKRHYLNEGLYIGQSTPKEAYYGVKPRSKKIQQDVNISRELRQGSDWFPLPMFRGANTITTGRDFKLSRDILDPLPKRLQPDDWHKVSKNRLIGEYAQKVFENMHKEDRKTGDAVCICVDECEPGDCLNHLMNYECDDRNCAVGAEYCHNRPFAELDTRLDKGRNRGNMHDIGVEVVDTKDRGFGIRSMRSFEPNQIIMEYTGEIIDEAELARRVRDDYKWKDQCYYLMTFIKGLFIDATKGSMARFVNHSCNPNCQMVMWKARGKPRMALFAKNQRIEPGEELTYDYNFEAFRPSEQQDCLCGSSNCRGVLGPRPRDVREPKVKDMLTKPLKTLKRKAQELLGNGLEAFGNGVLNKKQRITKTKTERTVVSRRALMAPAVAAEAASPHKAVQSASRDQRAAARRGSLPPRRSRAGIGAAKVAQAIKSRTQRGKVPPKRLNNARKMKVATVAKNTKLIQKSSASAAYAKKRQSIIAKRTSEKSTPRNSPRRNKTRTEYQAALDILNESDSGSDSEDLSSPDSSQVADELEDQIQNEMVDSPSDATQKTYAIYPRERKMIKLNGGHRMYV